MERHDSGIGSSDDMDSGGYAINSVVGRTRGVGAAREKVLVDFEEAVLVGEERRAVEGRVAVLRVALVHRGAQVDQVVDHVELPVRHGEVEKRAGPVVLGEEVGVRLENRAEHVGIAEARAAASE